MQYTGMHESYNSESMYELGLDYYHSLKADRSNNIVLLKVLVTDILCRKKNLFIESVSLNFIIMFEQNPLKTLQSIIRETLKLLKCSLRLHDPAELFLQCRRTPIHEWLEYRAVYHV